MKRIFSLALSLLLLCTFFAGCNKDKDDDKNKAKVDIKHYVELGQIPECDYSLGDDVEKIDEELEKHFKENEEAFYKKDESGEKSVLLDGGNFMYYYEKEKAKKGVSLIVCNETAFGFETGTLNIEIQEALSDYEYEEITDVFDELFFLRSIADATGIKYTFGGNVVIFAFSNNALVATAIYSVDNWTL